MREGEDALSVKQDREATLLRMAGVVVLVSVVTLAVVTAYRLFLFGTSTSRLMGWDQAEHGGAGVELAEAVRGVHPLRFLGLVNRMSLWPPFFPLMECPVFVVCGYDYGVARGLIAALFALCVILAYRSGFELHTGARHLVGGVAACLLLLSPMYRFYGTLVMLELPGAVLLLLSIGFYFRFKRRALVLDWKLCCLAATALFFTKYNYGLLWIVPIVLSELWEDAALRRRILVWLKDYVFSVRWGRPFPIFVLLYLIVMAGIALTGGWVISVAGQRISVRGLDNPAQILLAILMARAAVFIAVDRHGARRWYEGVGTVPRHFLILVFLPILIWMTIPPHLKDFLGFIGNRDSGLSTLSLDNLLFYPWAFAREYSRGAQLGMLVLVMGLLHLRFLWRGDPGDRALALALTLGLLTSLAHPYKDPRFFFTVAPLVWLACGRTVSWLVTMLTRRGPAALRLSVAPAMAVAVCVASALSHPEMGKLRQVFEPQNPPGNIRAVLNAVAGTALRSEGSVVLGTWNSLSPALVTWHCRLRTPGLDTAHIPIDARTLVGDLSPRPLLDALAAAQDVEKIMVIGLSAERFQWNGDFNKENAWLPAARAALDRDPRFRLDSAKDFEGTGYELLVFSRR